MKVQTMKWIVGIVAVAVSMFVSPPARAVVSIDWATVQNLSNPADSGGHGSVSYEYRIDKYEVNNSQFAGFLNAIAATDTYGVFNSSMSITRSGSSGSYTYSANSGFGNKPVTYLNVWDAMRFANWMNNGQPTGAQDNTTTENGAYTLTALSMANSTVTRNPGAVFFLPNVEEWVKAVYYDPTKSGSPYWLYPTRSDSTPTSEAPVGGSNSANYQPLNNGVGQGFGGGGVNLTDNGAYSGSYSHYGLFDAAGNAWEWNDSILGSYGPGTRGQFGGGFDYDSSFLQRTTFNNAFVTAENAGLGFRIAMIPEPASGALAGLALAGLWLRRRNK